MKTKLTSIYKGGKTAKAVKKTIAIRYGEKSRKSNMIQRKIALPI